MPSLRAAAKVVSHGDIKTSFDLEQADPAFVLEALASIIESASTALEVKPDELVRDLYSIITNKVKS